MKSRIFVNCLKPKALDLFCGAGGATRGLQNAGFFVVGIDIKNQPHYCGDIFIQANALNPPFRLEDFDLIWASPPCQAHVSLRWMYNAKNHENLIEPTRELLRASNRLFVIENVPGAPLRHELVLCGTMFELRAAHAELRRHRKFETSWQFPLFSTPPCRHSIRGAVIGVYGGHGRDSRRWRNGQDFPTVARREAMDIDWMTSEELSQAIPPAYAEYIGRAALLHLNGAIPG